MPQYNRIQYGLKQYGLFLPTTDVVPGFSYQFVEARMAVQINGKRVWVYQHAPVDVPGEPQILRLKTNQGETLYERTIVLREKKQKMRLRSNTSDWAYSEQKVEEERS